MGQRNDDVLLIGLNYTRDTTSGQLVHCDDGQGIRAAIRLPVAQPSRSWSRLPDTVKWKIARSAVCAEVVAMRGGRLQNS